MRRPAPQFVLAGLTGALVVVLGLGVPLVDDTFFWWVPKALLFSEGGGPWVLAGDLPTALRPDAKLPPHWVDGLPDYAHPPLWYAWLALWLKILGPHHWGVHLAVLPLAIGIGVGFAALLQRLGGVRAAWTAPVLVCLPPVAALLLRADTDVPLLLFSTWALVALLDQKDGLFALLAALAAASKEPGVLLVVPALAACWMDKRWTLGWLAPVAILGAWAGIHWLETGGPLGGWALASSEHLPAGPLDWLGDVLAVLRITLFEQGRWLILVGFAWMAWKGLPGSRRAWRLVSIHAGTQLLFFGTLNYLGGIDRVDRYTHVRYLLPGITSAAALGLAAGPIAAPPLLLASLWFLHERSDDGPEASLHGIDTARALGQARPLLEEIGGQVWVGSHAHAQLTRPYSGIGSPPLDHLKSFDVNTRPAQVSGHLVHASVGEPLGRLQELDLTLVREIQVHAAWVRLFKVAGEAAPPPASD